MSIRYACHVALWALLPLSAHADANADAHPESGAAVNVLYAGSLVDLMEHRIGPVFTETTGAEFRGYAGGSNKLANEIRAELRRGDVFVSANPKVDESLEGSANGNWVHWYGLFAESPLVIAYNPSSPIGARLGTEPWYQVLQQPGIRIGRTDPKLDPKGAFTLELLQRAETYYHLPGLAEKVLGPADNPAQVLPEEALVGRFQSGELDVGFFYATELVTNANAGMVRPIADIDPKARYTVTILRDAPNPKGAEAFLSLLLGPKGHEILSQAGFEIVSPAALQGDAGTLPQALSPLFEPGR